jgi:crossover junction endodeoxyribonuclease RuvC
MNKERIILGIDPGTTIMGYGLVKQEKKQLQILAVGVLKLDKITDPYSKLQRIFQRLISLIDEFHPDELAIEAPFFGKNVQSMLKLGRAQGVAIAAALSRDIPVFEYSPRKIKQSITGKGAASKEQVAEMLFRLLDMKEMPKYMDATDALAAAVCHFFQGDTPKTDTKYGGWASFLSKNEDRIIR